MNLGYLVIFKPYGVDKNKCVKLRLVLKLNKLPETKAYIYYYTQYSIDEIIFNNTSNIIKII